MIIIHCTDHPSYMPLTALTKQTVQFDSIRCLYCYFKNENIFAELPTPSNANCCIGLGIIIDEKSADNCSFSRYLSIKQENKPLNRLQLMSLVLRGIKTNRQTDTCRRLTVSFHFISSGFFAKTALLHNCCRLGL